MGGSSKWLVYNGKSYSSDFKWMIWGYPHGWGNLHISPYLQRPRHCHCMSLSPVIPRFSLHGFSVRQQTSGRRPPKWWHPVPKRRIPGTRTGKSLMDSALKVETPWPSPSSNFCQKGDAPKHLKDSKSSSGSETKSSGSSGTKRTSEDCLIHFNQPRDRKNPEFHPHVEPVRSLPQLTLGSWLHQPWSKDETQRPFLDDVKNHKKPSMLWLRVKSTCKSHDFSLGSSDFMRMSG